MFAVSYKGLSQTYVMLSHLLFRMVSACSFRYHLRLAVCVLMNVNRKISSLAHDCFYIITFSRELVDCQCMQGTAHNNVTVYEQYIYIRLEIKGRQPWVIQYHRNTIVAYSNNACADDIYIVSNSHVIEHKQI